ncbi:MAG: hypothetical protein GOP50_09400 [Candidatus Heimdallarchaeota archaeon]|nr:hypothetical protein [Candidatus Heimdallarchaeota archaeon]
MKTKAVYILSFSFISLIILLTISIAPSVCLADYSEEFENGLVLSENIIENETILEIIKIETYPSPAILNQPLFVNITVKNSGQFSMAEIKNVKIDANVKVSEGELYLEGSITDLAPGEIEIAKCNLTFLEIGLANVTFTLSADNIQSVSDTIQIEIVENTTTALLFEYTPILFCLVLMPTMFRKKRTKKVKI